MKKIQILIAALVILASFTSINDSKSAYAATKQWYTSTAYSENSHVKVKVDNPSKMTNKPVTITVDTTNYNNGDNVIIYNTEENNKTVTYGNKFTIKATANGDFHFLVLRKDYYDPNDAKLEDPNLIWCGATINNIDKSKPTLKFVNTYVDSWSSIQFLKVDVSDDSSIYRVKLPDGSYNSGIREIKGSDIFNVNNNIEVEVYKNGKYTFVAEDFAGNRTEKTFTINNCNPVPLKINKVTVNSKFITGKTLPNAHLIIKTENYSYYEDNIEADKNGYFKAKLNKKLKLNNIIVARVMDSKQKSKYSSNKIKVKVVKK